MTYAEASFGEYTNYVAMCRKYLPKYTRYFDMETDAKMFIALFGSRPMWG